MMIETVQTGDAPQARSERENGQTQRNGAHHSQPETSATLAQLQADAALWEEVKDDPITLLLLSGQAATAHEAEARFLAENVDAICQQVLELAQSDLSDAEFARQPLIVLLRSHGSRPWEDSLL
jgi:hypothetical protein